MDAKELYLKETGKDRTRACYERMPSVTEHYISWLETKVTEQNQALQLQQTGVSGSLPYNEKVLMHLWYGRNPSHEINTNTEEDMFWKTVFMVMKDYIREVGGNDR